MSVAVVANQKPTMPGMEPPCGCRMKKTVGSGMIDTHVFNAENRWQTEIRVCLSEGRR